MSGYIGSKAVFLSTTAAVVDGNITVSGTVDGVDIAARDAVLTSTTTTAGAALPKSGGTMTGGLTVDSGNGDQLSLDNAGERFTQISFKHNGAQEAALWYDATDDYLVAHGSAGDGFKVQTGGSNDRLTITSSGNVGIGTSASLTNLSVAGSESSFLSRVNIDVSDNANRTLTLSEQKITFAAPDTYGTNYNAFINYGLTSLQFAVGNTERMRIDLSGAVTMPAQPAFLAQVATVQSNLANYVNVVIFGTEVFDQNADFNPSNGIFTAPVTGKYMLSTFIGLDQIPATGTGVLQLQIAASNRTVYAAFDPIVFDATSTKYTFTQSLLVDMDASDTAKIQIYMPVASSTVDISTASWFSGYLVA